MEIGASAAASRVTLNSGFQQSVKGLQKARKLATNSSLQIANGNVSPEQVINLKTAEYAFKANAIVLKTHDQMVGTILNTFA